MKLRDYQARCVDAVLEAFQSVTSTLVVLPTGCHRAGTPILLWDGRVVPVETITKSDVLIGPDGGPRQILQLVNGRGEMAEIVPTKGDPFVVNLDHILTLQRTRDHSEASRERRYPSARREGEIVDVSVREWLTWSKTRQNLYKLFRVGADFHRALSPLQLPPYFVGLILGDGAVAHSYTNITTGDREVVSYLRGHALELGYKLRFERNSPKSWVIHLTSGRGSRLANYIRSTGLRGLNSGTKFVPDNYRVASRQSRLELLAGLIDTDGSLNGGCYDFISKSRQLSDDVVFIARSLGLAAYVKPCEKRAQTGGGGTYYRVCISGEISQIPCRIKRKRASARLQKKSVNRTGFAVRLLGDEDYYGFTLTGDGRYLMGDFTVTHNCGKTVVFAHVIDRMRSMGRCKVLAHREELIFQARDKIEKVTGIRPDVEMADLWAAERGLFGQKSPIVVSTVQTQNAGNDGEGRKARFDPSEFILIVVDEGHHGTSVSYRKVVGYYRQNPKLKVLYVTATPDRHDEEALGQVCESVAFEYGVVDAIADGWLTPIRQQVVSVSDLDLSQVRTTAGDLNGADLAKVLEFEKTLHGMVAPTLEIVGERKTLIFAASVAQAERIAEIINRHKPGKAECIFGNTEKDRRRELLRQYATGMFQFLVNVGVATEGFDAPDIDVVVMGRPTESRALYAQMLGRGTRPLPGIVDGVETPDARREAIAGSAKPSLLVLDFVGNAGRHKLIHAADILGGNYSDNIVERAKREIERKGKDADVSEELKKAEREQREEEAKFEEAKRRTLKFGVKHTARDVNPFDVLDLVPEREPGWHRGRQPSEKMIEMLERHGIQSPERLSFVQAGQLCGEIIKRFKEKRPTFKQARFLKRRGIDPNVTSQEAKRIIDEIAEREGWGNRRASA